MKLRAGAHRSIGHTSRQIVKEPLYDVMVEAPPALEAEQGAIIRLHEIQSAIEPRIFLPAHIYLGQKSNQPIRGRSPSSHPAIEVEAFGDVEVLSIFVEGMDFRAVTVAGQHERESRPQITHGDMQTPPQVCHGVQHLQSFRQTWTGSFILKAPSIMEGVTALFQVTLLAIRPELRSSKPAQRTLKD